MPREAANAWLSGMKKFLLGLAVVVVVAIGGLAVFVRVASRDAPPPDETEFAAERPDVAPADNAFTYFLEATNLLVETTNRQWFVDFRMDKAPASDELRSLVATNAECLALVKRGIECAICLPPPVETIDTLTPYVNPWLHMEEILEARTRLARLDGRFEDAADDLAVGLRFGDLVQKDASSLIGYLVGVAIFSASAESAMELARDPAAPPETLAQLAAELEKAGPFDGGLVLAMKTEHRTACNVVDDLRKKQEQMMLYSCIDSNTNRWMEWLSNFRYFFQPNRTKRDLAEAHRFMIDQATRIYADIEPFDISDKEGGSWAVLRPNVIGNSVFLIMLPSETIVEARCRTDGLLAGAKLVVACHRFARDKGRWPETLAELVPEYLGEVPRDPFDGAPFRYSAEKSLVWAVGKNLTDEGGSTRLLGVEPASPAGRDRRRAEDFVFDLKPTEKAE